ncbi:MAG: hypothetical protein KJ804_01785 [Proteobacteria bacterium]|nr:hypothetical protein [Pseudomonadota bacterium]MBU1057036.1 hypothetical protein [Pseudomonadota bacterium]
MRRLLILACICLLGLTACSSWQGSEKIEEAQIFPELSCIAVLPATVPVESSGATAEGKSLVDGAAYLDSVLAELLAGKEQFHLLSGYQIDGILSDPWGGKKEQLRTIGKATGCEGVLETSLSQYRQRVGTELSAETPAAVSFSMDLVDVETGAVLWSASFDEAQKTLFENILSFKKAESRGFKWITVEELTRKGVQSRLAGFPYYQK